jgi:hypothetical protein
MAARQLPAPGTKYGPCEGECADRDCAAIRAEAAAICEYCNISIGYEVSFYRDGTGVRASYHAVCLEDAIDREAKRV